MSTEAQPQQPQPAPAPSRVPPTVIDAPAALAKLDEFDAIIDVRSPSEFAEDHLPGALNWPVLDDEQRRVVGTLYKASPFEARKLGAALVARNIAQHLDAHGAALPRNWRPLVYCWRGGQRSGAMHWFLGQIGFKSRQLAGGYKAYRTEVRLALDAIPLDFPLHVLCGRTGSGKTRLLHALRAQGAQVLDLEGLARHRGSVLGALPDQAQPSQKGFDSLLWQALKALDLSRPIFVESESRKIGLIRLPEALHTAMRATKTCYWLEMPDAARVQLLLEDYAHFKAQPDQFCTLLSGLVTLRGHQKVSHWQALARAGDFASVFGELMREHYDPGYERSLSGHYPQLAQARQLHLPDGGPQALSAVATQMLQNP
ncbi:tRNA 2-selenouridine(34) synthase MnmH [Roseateles koreensis]|uniref:tRNA 2-selenouridine(34) synthase MnmH n=1 Tax=Roseateles koreensis TaxID=2987526 RepID=A0ABT5KLU5_9BURK|nr:tRNA 2-selenouridine(34) synthase MnmH [Roseateles koreensis]MDC8783834.1 tRNA 2-selenouridine(34) synthase MnmH [Roseateles koreensis]